MIQDVICSLTVDSNSNQYRGSEEEESLSWYEVFGLLAFGCIVTAGVVTGLFYCHKL